MKNGDARFAARHLRATFPPYVPPFAAPVKRPLKKWRNKAVPIIKPRAYARGFTMLKSLYTGAFSPLQTKQRGLTNGGGRVFGLFKVLAWPPISMSRLPVVRS